MQSDVLFRTDWEALNKQERCRLRQEKLKPWMKEFFNWCRQNKATVLPGSKLGKAISYSLKHQETFENVLLDGHLELSNNKAERAVKSLVMGRRNWLFSQSFAGVKASGIILSLIETAKRNGLDPEKYLKYLLEKLPNEKDLESNTLEAYLPWQKRSKSFVNKACEKATPGMTLFFVLSGTPGYLTLTLFNRYCLIL